MPPRHLSLPANQRFWRRWLTGSAHLTMDSELSHSVVGSYLNPPERMCPPSFTQNEAFQNYHPGNSLKMCNSLNNQALVSALKTLQEKIRRLELERTQAEDNLNLLSREAAQYKKALEMESNERNLAHQELIKQKKDISIQLSSAQSRCILLEKQLEYTKRMVLNVEREKTVILEQQAQLQREKEQDQMKLHAKLEKLHVLEKECLRLTATQQNAEDKIKYLEEKLKEEEHQRRLFQDKACEKTNCLKREPRQQMDHKFRAPTFKRETPFRVTAQARANSHSSGEPVSVCDSLSELMMTMQDELDQMNMEHRELLRQMIQTESRSVSEDLEHELDRLVQKMESKEDQISRLKKHQDSVRKLQEKVENSRINESSGIHGNPKRSKKLKTSPQKCVSETSAFQRDSSFQPVQVHSLQTKLRRDDIKWEQ
ncbi:centrosomal protein CEP57L1 isoform X7 [Arvicanthis niloticus]|uniref:centrosomal protein CEP57L1 isoform X7 n=1 Tax=Arvicanthis niloticus TaxID=61156 RepID=UPI001485D292|nr:centrosomal protein CEP57L1 isoform X3 [Arvicanthis niloticus]